MSTIRYRNRACSQYHLVAKLIGVEILPTVSFKNEVVSYLTTYLKDCCPIFQQFIHFVQTITFVVAATVTVHGLAAQIRR
jgi:hypothetical protein